MYYYLLTGACLLLTHGSFAQTTSPNVISTAGSSTQNGSVIIDQTIGEPLTTTHVSGSNTLTQGFEQPVVSSVGISEWESAQVQLFPNPAQHAAIVKIPLLTYSYYAVYDAAGRLVAESGIAADHDQFIFMVDNYQSGIYKLLLKGKIETTLTFIKL
jgi:hypothetical protein